MTILIVLVVVVLLLLFVGALYNGLVRKRNSVDNGWSQIDVQLKRRLDLIPNLVETVKGYAEHEREALEAVIAARNGAVAARGTQCNRGSHCVRSPVLQRRRAPLSQCNRSSAGSHRREDVLIRPP